ncbi:hypothetical protein BGZ63DRAFT_462355 [Mariannaea sp. PMI_226]|nr:hypothetical protein BGZ63DRAFT_462355 [Mariannaea sp. PMI_226]
MPPSSPPHSAFGLVGVSRCTNASTVRVSLSVEATEPRLSSYGMSPYAAQVCASSPHPHHSNPFSVSSSVPVAWMRRGSGEVPRARRLGYLAISTWRGNQGTLPFTPVPVPVPGPHKISLSQPTLFRPLPATTDTTPKCDVM